jgi:signal transduction histidine kinase
MAVTLRQRILLTLLPLIVLIFVVGGVASVLLYHLGDRIDSILFENYDSVLYMERLNEALERIDSSFQFALSQREDKARAQYSENWPTYQHWYQKEAGNITEPGEGELVQQLDALTKKYRQQGDAFYARTAGDAKRGEDYYASGGLEDTFKQIKTVSAAILRLNQESMEQASGQARRTARRSLVGFAIGLAAATVLAFALAWRTAQNVIHPIRSVTESAVAIGLGNLDQVVAVEAPEELRRLGEAFNTMARQLRHYRQTDYARLLRAQRTSQATIDSFPNPVLVVDSEGHVEMANPAARRLLGVAAPAEDRSSLVVWNPPEGLRQPLTEALRDQRPFAPEGFERILHLRQDGQDHALLPRILPIRDPYGNTLGAAVLLLDVTRFRLLDQLKNDLVATVSHELKTPLTSIRLAVYLMLEETVGPLTAKQTELLLDARENAERLLARVNNLLDLARLEERREPLEIRREDPAALLQNVADAVRPRADDKGIALVVEAPPGLPPLAADALRLAHALNNLLDNALIYTERGGRIVLSAARGGPGEVVLTVSDTGCGIPAEHLPRVFDRFFRVPGQSLEGGTGLGLAIVREIVTAHDGTVRCESTPGVGTTFRLTLPAWKEDRLAATAAADKENGRVQ